MNKKLRHWWFEMAWCTCEVNVMVQNPPHVLLWYYIVFMRIWSNRPRGTCRNEYVKYNCSQSHHAKYTPLPMFCCVLLWLAINWFYPFPSGLLQAHWGNHTSVPVPVKQLINNHMIPTKISNKNKPKHNKTVCMIYGTRQSIYIKHQLSFIITHTGFLKISTTDQSDESHNAPVPYPTMHMCTFLFWMVQCGKCRRQVPCGICKFGL